jgi:hypothetical protein
LFALGRCLHGWARSCSIVVSSIPAHTVLLWTNCVCGCVVTNYVALIRGCFQGGVEGLGQRGWRVWGSHEFDFRTQKTDSSITVCAQHLPVARAAITPAAAVEPPQTWVAGMGEICACCVAGGGRHGGRRGGASGSAKMSISDTLWLTPGASRPTSSTSPRQEAF